MNSINIRKEALSGPSGARVALSGAFTENTDFSPLLAAPEPLMVFDLSEVKRINSCGMREWITFVRALAGKGTQFVFERCSVAFVNQLNMISNFRGGARVASIYAPFFCPGCEADRPVLIPVDGELRAKLEDAPSCPECRGAMEFDDIPDSYVSFLG